jgi:hypothetical protein
MPSWPVARRLRDEKASCARVVAAQKIRRMRFFVLKAVLREHTPELAILVWETSSIVWLIGREEKGNINSKRTANRKVEELEGITASLHQQVA